MVTTEARGAVTSDARERIDSTCSSRPTYWRSGAVEIAARKATLPVYLLGMSTSDIVAIRKMTLPILTHVDVG